MILPVLRTVATGRHRIRTSARLRIRNIAYATQQPAEAGSRYFKSYQHNDEIPMATSGEDTFGEAVGTQSQVGLVLSERQRRNSTRYYPCRRYVFASSFHRTNNLNPEDTAQLLSDVFVWPFKSP